MENLEFLEFIKIDELIILMIFLINDLFFVGKEGEYVILRYLRECFFKEFERNVGLKVEEIDLFDLFKVLGRGEFYFVILIEIMRREGYEF